MSVNKWGVRAQRVGMLCTVWTIGVLVLGGCREAGGSLPVGSDGGDTLYIGVAAGSGASVNETVLRGVRMAVDEHNGARTGDAPPLGVRLPGPDGMTQSDVARGFRDDPRVVGVVGHTSSGAMLEAAPIYADLERRGRRALVAVSPTATNPEVTHANDWVFRVCPTDLDGARQLARFVTDSLPDARVAVVYDNGVFGRGFSRVFAREMGRLGLPARERFPFLPGITRLDAYAARMAQQGVNTVLIAGLPEHASELAAAIRAAGLSVRYLGSDDLFNIVDDANAVAALDGARYVSFYLPGQPLNERAAAFEAAHRARYGSAPSNVVALAYDAATLIAQAVREAGDEREAVRDWIAGVGRTRPALTGVTGEIRFDEHGDAVEKRVRIAELTR